MTMVVPPIVVKPIVVIAPIVLPVVVDLGEIVFTPVVPAITIVDAIGAMVGPIAVSASPLLAATILARTC
jgi:hypothetical protein